MRNSDSFASLGGSLGTIACFKSIIDVIRPYSNKFKFLTIDGVLRDAVPEVTLEHLKELGDVFKAYDDWDSEAFTNHERSETLSSAVIGLYNAHKIWHPDYLDATIDPRKVLDLDLLADEVIPRLMAAMFALSKIKEQTIYRIIEQEIAFYTACVSSVLYSALNFFKYSESENAIPESDILELQGIEGFEKFPVYVLHAEQQVLNEEEQYEREHAAELAARREQEARELEAARESVKKHANSILDSYNKLKDMGALRTFRFSDNVVNLLQTPDSIDNCEKIESLYKFLMALPNASHYLPGEGMRPEDETERLNWAFTDLDTEVIKHHVMLTLTTKIFGLMELNIAQALELLNDDESRAENKIVAQYTESKEYIDNIEADPSLPGPVPKQISVFLMI